MTSRGSRIFQINNEEKKYQTEITTYRQKIIPMDYNNEIIKNKYIRFYKSEWVYIIHKVKFYHPPQQDIWYFGQPDCCMLCHPLVDKGHGFWINDCEIVTGYRLRKNPSIIRPIFDFNRELIFRKVKLYINRYMKFHMAIVRQKMVEKELVKLKFLPIVIISNILKYCYDPLLLL